MLSFQTFLVQAAMLLAVMLALLGVALRSADIKLWVKLTLMAMFAIFACFTPMSVRNLMGLPVPVDLTTLPKKMELIAFQGVEGGATDIWVVSTEYHQPRAFEVVLPDDLKKEMDKAREDMAKGKHVFLERDKGEGGEGGGGGQDAKNKGAGNSGQTYGNLRDNQTRFHIVGQFDMLPKGADE